MVNLKSPIKNAVVSPRTVGSEGLLTEKSGTLSKPVSPVSTGRWNQRTYLRLKNCIDRVAALVSLILLSPALLLISILIRLDSPGHPLFLQARVGKNGRQFTAYKFRTMQINNDDTEYKDYLQRYILQNAPYKVDKNGSKIYKLVDDPRITRFGRILRKTNLDELPQLINILRGQMSFIGPRPDIPYSVALYHERHRDRLKVTPGITGLWQVRGRKELSFNEMVEIDLEYIRKVSPALDLKITLLTILTILLGDGS